MADYDVVVNGAGPAGSVTALLLARAGARVLLIDRVSFPRDKPCAESLSPEINVMLRDLGLTAAVEAAHPAHVRGFQVYTQSGQRFTGRFAGRNGDESERSYGLALPRTVFDTLLLQAAVAAGAVLHERTRVTALETQQRGVVLHTVRGEKRETIHATFAVAADGVRSVLARGLTLLQRCPPYRIALVTHMSGIADLSLYGEIHASPEGGYCGVAALGDGRANVAMVVAESEGRRIAGDPAGYLRSALAAYPQLGPRLRAAEPCKAVLTTSGLSWRARRFHGPRLLLVGDATGYYDPLTGEGIFRAMAGARLAAPRLLAALASGEKGALSGYDGDLRRLYRGKRLLEQVLDIVVHQPHLFRYIAGQLQRHPELADTLIGVTGDILSPWQVLNPSYLARLVL